MTTSKSGQAVNLGNPEEAIYVSEIYLDGGEQDSKAHLALYTTSVSEVFDWSAIGS